MERSHLTAGSYVRAAVAGNSAHGVSTERPDWRDKAECQRADPEVFFPEQADLAAQTKEALAICRQCPVDYECWWDQVLSGDEAWGIRGGQRPAALNRSIEALREGGDQRPEVEAKQKADQERAEREASRQAERDAARARATEEREARRDEIQAERRAKAREWDRAYRERVKEKLSDPAAAAKHNEDRAEYMEARRERQREASRKYAAKTRAREREERQATEAWDVPGQRQPERDQEIAEVA